MNYLVTGATGFIGKFLIDYLLARTDAQVYVLIRESSRQKYQSMCDRYDDRRSRIHALIGDVTIPGLMAKDERAKIVGKIDHIFHLAAVYDMYMDDITADRVNVDGTMNVVEFANTCGNNVTLHHVSSIAVAGSRFIGRFTEDMFDAGQSIDHPYYRSKFQSEKIVRDFSHIPFRIYRPGIVVGDSRTGEMDKVDGPYYFFKAIQRASQAVPKWVPLYGLKGGHIPVVPVDYVAAAMDAIGHKPNLDRKTFFLVPQHAPTLGEMLSTIMKAAHGPTFRRNFELASGMDAARSINQKLGTRIPQSVQREISRIIGIPVAIFSQALNQTRYDDRNAQAALLDTGIQCPDFSQYANKLWSYWETFLDIGDNVPEPQRKALQGKIIMVTGATSGIGLLTARKLAASGARVILVARTLERLDQVALSIRRSGGEAHVYPCDLNNMAAVDKMTADVLRDLGFVDVLVNNAGRSIQRGIKESLDRFHDFERTMKLNYFGSLRLIQRLLPAMITRKSGHILNISSIGVLANAPRFSAYVASKSALDAFSRCLAAEVRADGIQVSTIYMPLVRTPMIAPTKLFDYVPTWSTERAADTVIQAIVTKPKSIASNLGRFASINYALWPNFSDLILSTGHRLLPVSTNGIGQATQAQTQIGNVGVTNVLESSLG